MMAVDGTDGRRRGKESGMKERSPRLSTGWMIDDSAWVWRMGGLTRDGTVAPGSQDQILTRGREQGRLIFSVQLHHENDWQHHTGWSRR